MAQWRQGTADTVISRGIKPHGDSQQCRQSLPRSSSTIAYGNQDTDLRTQTNGTSLMHSYAYSQLNAVASTHALQFVALEAIVIHKSEKHIGSLFLRPHFKGFKNAKMCS